MASEAKAIMAQVVTQLQTANGAGVYSYDLSATGTVVRGAVLNPPQSDLLVSLFLVPMETPPGDRLGYNENVLHVRVVGWVAHDGTEGASEDAALDLLDTIKRAIRTDRTLSGLVRDAAVTGSAFSGGTYGWDGFGVASGDLRINWSQATGV